MSKSDTSSEDLSELNDDATVQEMLANEPMYYVLSQFLDTEDDPPKNIATLLKELVIELRGIKDELRTLNASKSTVANADS